MTEKDTPENANADAASEQETASSNVVPISGTAAKAIMGDPAAAAGMNVSPEVLVQRVLTALPGLVGAIDYAIKDQTGKHQPFVLLVFAEGTALHSANFAPEAAKLAVMELVQHWGEEPPHMVEPGGEEAAANDATQDKPGVTH